MVNNYQSKGHLLLLISIFTVRFRQMQGESRSESAGTPW